MFPGCKYEVVGEPEDLQSARALAAEDRYQFQWWALSLISAKPLGDSVSSKKVKEGKKGSDRGIDGVIVFLDDAKREPKRILVSVKSGQVNSGMVRDLRGVVEREKAAIGVFLTLEPPTKDMRTEAASAEFYRSEGFSRSYPRIQILTIAELFAGGTRYIMPADMSSHSVVGSKKPGHFSHFLRPSRS